MAETADVQRLVALVEANTKQFERAMDRLAGVTRSSMSKVEKEVNRVNQALSAAGVAATNFVRGFAVGAITAGVAGLAAMAKNAIATAAALQDVADNTGIASTELQKMAFAAEQSGGNAESLLASFRKFNVEIGEARLKGGDLAKILKDNGVSLEQDNLAIWRQIVDLIANAKTETEAAYLAQLAMGRSASENLNFFRQGSAEIARIGQQAEDSGAIIDAELVKKADEFADRWAAAMTKLQSQISKWIITMLGALETFSEKMERMSTEFQLSGRSAAGYLLFGPGAGKNLPNVQSGANFPGGSQNLPTRQPTIIDIMKPGKTENPIETKIDAVNVRLEKTKTLSETIADNFSNLGSTLLGVARGTETLAQAMQRMLDKLLDTLADQYMQQLIAAMLGALGPKTLGTSTFTSGAQARQLLSFGGRRQSGGAVARGKSYLVGERGPELFSPNTAGYIMPRGRGGGGGTQVHIHTPPGMMAETRQDNQGGQPRIDVIIREMVRKELPGALRPVMRDQYAISPATRRRF